MVATATAERGSCVVLVSHRLCDTTLSRLDALREGLGARMQVVLALTEPLGRAVAACGVPDALVLPAAEIFRAEYGAKGASRKIVPGNADLVTQAVRRARPGHAHYWYIEYDVWFAGGAGVLADLDAASDADLLMPLRDHTRAAAPTWWHWPGVVIPEDDTPPESVQRHALLCVHRASARLLDAADSAYRRGWSGHFEAMLPTIAAAHGFGVERLTELSRQVLGRPVLDPRSFGAHGCNPSAPDMIYHPVKTADAERDLREGRSVSRRK